MTRRLGLCFLAVLLLANPLLAKRRAVTPGAGRCVVGPIAILAYTTLLTTDAQHVYTEDYAIDGCAIVMGTAGGELVRTAR